LVHCDGSLSAIVSSKECSIPISSLFGSPYNLVAQSSVYAKVAAVNVVGVGAYSQGGNGAVIQISFAPDAPINLARDSNLTTINQIVLIWSAGASNGGNPIIDYRVTYD